MPNSGHYWTTEEDQELLRARSLSNKSDQAFSKEYADIHRMSADAVRNRIQKLRQHIPDNEGASYEEGDDFIHIICASRRMLNKEDVIRQFKIDVAQWEIEKFKVKTSEGYRKDREVKWIVKNGVVTEGRVNDSGKMLVVPLYHIEVHLIRKTDEIRAANAIQEQIADARRFSPKYPKVIKPKQKDGLLYEIDMPDLHFGRLTWEEETGENYDIQIARQTVHQVLNELLADVDAFPIEKILLPLGNDFFNVNNKEGTTTHGTRQQEDTRWQKTFKAGRILAVEMIDACSGVAPVDVLIVPGNHDEERMFYLGDALECWYHACKNVTIDNRANKRKYYSFGKTLLGLTHGSEEKKGILPGLMPLEQPELWAQSKYREWHTGDKHHTNVMVQEVDEQLGVVVRILRSLVPADAWTFDSGFVGAVRAAESFMWHPEKGLIAQFTSIPQIVTPPKK